MQIRIATPNDAFAIGQVLGRAYSVLLADSYDADVLALALPSLTKANPGLLSSGTYYVAEDAGRLLGCGGWTFERPGSGTLQDGLCHLRHFATDPAIARRGIGRAIFERCAASAADRGGRMFQAFASLNAERFYGRFGLERLCVTDILLGGRIKFPAVLMEGPVSRAEGR